MRIGIQLVMDDLFATSFDGGEVQPPAVTMTESQRFCVVWSQAKTIVLQLKVFKGRQVRTDDRRTKQRSGPSIRRSSGSPPRFGSWSQGDGGALCGLLKCSHRDSLNPIRSHT